MMESNEEKLSRQEQVAFRELSMVSLPFGLEEQIALQLDKEGLLTTQKSMTMKNWIISAAASVAFFILGYYLAPLSEIQDTPATGLTKYAILLYEDESFKGDDQALIAEYRNWGQSWGKQGKLAGGEKLTYEANWFGASFDLPDSPGMLTGFFIIQVSNYEEALEITKTHPHTKYGGRIELREIEKI